MSQKTCPDNNRLSLVGWGKSEGEEPGAILRVSEALRIFCLGRRPPENRLQL